MKNKMTIPDEAVQAIQRRLRDKQYLIPTTVLQDAIEAAPSPRAQALEEEEAAIDELRLQAFRTNSNTDRQAYFDAVSKWFQDRHYRRMDAERALSSQHVADGWFPIETAPKDGTDIIVWSTMYRGKPVIVRWEEDKYAKRPIQRWITSDSAYGARSFVDSPPTHWRALPASPGASATRPTGGSNHGE